MSLSKKNNNKYEKMKTLCTLDSNDIFLNQDIYKSLLPKKKGSQARNKKKLSLLNHSPQKLVDNLTYTNFNDSRTPKNRAMRINNSVHKSRMRTQNYEISLQKTPKRQFSCCKKIEFHCDEKYNFQTYQIVKKKSQTKGEKIYIVKYLHNILKNNQYLMKKSNNQTKQKQFARQLLIKQELTNKLKSNQKKYFSNIFRHYYEKKNIILVFNSLGTELDWQSATHKRFIKNIKNNNHYILKHMIKQLARAISILSSYSYAHSSIQLKNILVQIEDNKQTLKVSKSIKLANLGNCIKMNNKKNFLAMNRSLNTPPEIINYMIFQNSDYKDRIQNFDRQLIQFIEIQDQGWKIDVWSLGILILQLLHEGPLLNEYLNLGQILQYQKTIKIRSQFLLQKIQDQTLKVMVTKMLQTNPLKRASPQQIISTLSKK